MQYLNKYVYAIFTLMRTVISDYALYGCQLECFISHLILFLITVLCFTEISAQIDDFPISLMRYQSKKDNSTKKKPSLDY